MNIIENEPSEIVQAEPTDLMQTLSDMPLGQLRAAAKRQSGRRKVIAEFVKNELKAGIDYGTIKSEKNGKKFESKPALWKPGQEKIFSLFGLTSTLQKDTETLEMLGNITGLVAYVCKVFRNGQFIAEGRGAAEVDKGGRDANSTIKIAEKRARMDACLALGFSEFFTQDIDDPDYNKGTDNGTATPRPATVNQKNFVVGLLKQAGHGTIMATALKANGVVDPNNMTADEASKMIETLKAGTFKAPEAPEGTDPDTGEINEGEEPEPITLPDPEVNLQFQEDVNRKMLDLGLDTREQMRVFRDVTGTPVPPKAGDPLWLEVDKHLNVMAANEVA